MRTLLLIFLTFTSMCWARDIIDIENFGCMQQQDIYVNGTMYRRASEYKPSLEDQYEFLKIFLNHYERPFTILDICSEQNYFSFRAASEFPKSVFVMLEGNNDQSPMISAQLQDICAANTELRNIIWLNKSPSSAQINHLSTCEHFDVILIKNVTKRFPNDWKTVVQALKKMAHILIIEDSPETPRMINDILKKDSAFVFPITTLSTTTYLYVYVSETGFLERTSYIHGVGDHRKWEIQSNFSEKIFIRKDKKPPYAIYKTQWIPGINLITYLMLGGQFPARETVASLLMCAPQHKDFMLNNFILQGNQSLSMIDQEDHNQGYHCKPELILFLHALILEKDPKEFLRKMNTLFPHDPPLLRDYSQSN